MHEKQSINSIVVIYSDREGDLYGRATVNTHSPVIIGIICQVRRRRKAAAGAAHFPSVWSPCSHVTLFGY